MVRAIVATDNLNLEGLGGTRSMTNDRANLQAICSPTSTMMDGIW